MPPINSVTTAGPVTHTRPLTTIAETPGLDLDRVAEPGNAQQLNTYMDKTLGDIGQVKDPFHEATSVLQAYFVVFDAVTSRNADGKVSQDDLKAIASGNFNRGMAETRLKLMGVPESQWGEVLQRVQDTAQYFLDNPEKYNRLDAQQNAKNDGIVSRGDVDGALATERNRAQEGVAPDQALQAVDQYFEVFDNPGGGKPDGMISRDDLQKVAEGDFNKDTARHYLRRAGVKEQDLEAALIKIQGTAQFLLDSHGQESGLYRKLDEASSATADGKISRQDVNTVITRKRNDAETRQPWEMDPQLDQNAQSLSQEWIANPDLLEARMGEKPSLQDWHQTELQALYLYKESLPPGSPDLARIDAAVDRAILQAEKLSDLPQGKGFASLAHDREQEPAGREGLVLQTLGGKMDQLAAAEVTRCLDRALLGARGDDGLDAAISRFAGDVSELAARYPSMATEIIATAMSEVQKRDEQFTTINQADDSLVQRFNRALDQIGEAGG